MEGLILYLRVGTNLCVNPFWKRLFLGGHMDPPLLVILDEETSLYGFYFIFIRR